MRIFLDTNVILDYLCKREPFCKDADILFEIFERKIHTGIVSTLTVINTAYILHKLFPKQQIKGLIDWLCSDFEVVSVRREDVVLANNNASAKDFEDAVQYYSALSHNPDLILTRDKNGFEGFGVTVMTPSEFIAASRKA